MLFSLGVHNKEHKTIYLLYSHIPKQKLEAFSNWVMVNCNGELISIPIKSELFADAPKQKWWPEEIYYRLLAFDILPPEAHRALWLDADIIVNGNIQEFYSQSFDGCYAVVCQGCNQTFNANLGLPEDHIYFNSGVILYNLETIRQNFHAKDIFACIDKHKAALCAPDQDVLNILFAGNLKYANEEVYNNETFGTHVLSRKQMRTLQAHAKIIHFNGPMKPWNPKGVNWADRYWWKYERMHNKFSAFLLYRIKNLPIKLYCILRELYFILKAHFF